MARQMLQAFLYKGTQLGTKAKTAITNVRNGHVHPSPILHHVAVDCSTSNTSCILMSFSLLFSIISRFPPKELYAADIGGSTPTLICFKNQNHHHPPKPPQLALAPPVTRSSASSTSADSVRKCRFSETNSSPR